MKTYAEKLNSKEWHNFRNYTIKRQGGTCINCGHDETNTPLHVHHKRYVYGREPWDYDQKDVEVICRTCHDRIHSVEKRWRDLIRSSPAYVAWNFQDLIEILEKLDERKLASALCRAKCAAKEILYTRFYNDET